MDWIYTETELFRHNSGDISLYHVFGLASTKSGCVMAFSEARHGDGDDAGCTHDIVLRVSRDNGSSFEPETVLIEGMPGQCLVNPVPLYDTGTGRMWLFYADNFDNKRTDVYVMYTDDDAKTWSKPVCMNETLKENDPVGHPVALPGPGHGICLKNGRLILPVWHRKYGVDVPAKERGYCVSALYSDDNGNSWQHTGCFAQDILGNESRIAENANGLIWIIRPGNNLPTRYYMLSKDNGISWTSPVLCQMNPANNCDDGVVSFNAGPGYEDTLLVSRVTSMVKRFNMEILISRDGGISFESVMELPHGDAMPGYSDLTIMPDGVVGLLHCRCNHVLFSRISMQALTGGKFENSTRKVWM